MNVYLEPVITPTTRFYSLFTIMTRLPALMTCNDRFFRATRHRVSLVFPTCLPTLMTCMTRFFKNKNTGIKRGVKRVKSVRLKQLEKTRHTVIPVTTVPLRIPHRGGDVGA